MALTIVGSASAAGNTIAIPAHQVGDLIVIWAYRDGNTTAPSKPAAGGTVPAWSDPPSAASGGSNTNSNRCAYRVATTTTNTSGTWTNATGMAVVVLRGQGPTPIGAIAQAGGAATSATAPAITPQRTDGTSVFLQFYGHRTVTAWGSVPTGYTRLTSVATEVCVNSKNDTTSDGSQAQSLTGTSSGYRAHSIEILAPPPKIATFKDRLNDLANWTTGGTPTIVSRQVQLGSDGVTADQMSSVRSWDLTGSEIAIGVTQLAAGYREGYFGLVPPGGNAFGGSDLGFFLTGSGSTVNVHVNGSDTASFTAPATPFVLFIRESGGTVTFETAASYAGTRTSRGTATTPAFASVCQVHLAVYYVASAADPVITFDNLNAGPPAKVATLTDDFNDNSLDLTKWRVPFGPAPTESGNALHFPGTSSGAYVETVNVYDLTGSSLTGEYVSGPAGQTNASLALNSTDGSGLGLFAWVNPDGTRSFGSQNDSVGLATSDRFFRIRESGGTIYFDSSADFLTWTNRHSFTVASFGAPVDEVTVGIGGYTTGAGPYADIVWDNVNLAPSVSALRLYMIV